MLVAPFIRINFQGNELPNQVFRIKSHYIYLTNLYKSEVNHYQLQVEDFIELRIENFTIINLSQSWLDGIIQLGPTYNNNSKVFIMSLQFIQCSLDKFVFIYADMTAVEAIVYENLTFQQSILTEIFFDEVPTLYLVVRNLLINTTDISYSNMFIFFINIEVFRLSILNSSLEGTKIIFGQIIKGQIKLSNIQIDNSKLNQSTLFQTLQTYDNVILIESLTSAGIFLIQNVFQIQIHNILVSDTIIGVGLIMIINSSIIHMSQYQAKNLKITLDPTNNQLIRFQTFGSIIIENWYLQNITTSCQLIKTQEPYAKMIQIYNLTMKDFNGIYFLEVGCLNNIYITNFRINMIDSLKINFQKQKHYPVLKVSAQYIEIIDSIFLLTLEESIIIIKCVNSYFRQSQVTNYQSFSYLEIQSRNILIQDNTFHNIIMSLQTNTQNSHLNLLNNLIIANIIINQPIVLIIIQEMNVNIYNNTLQLHNSGVFFYIEANKHKLFMINNTFLTIDQTILTGNFSKNTVIVINQTVISSLQGPKLKSCTNCVNILVNSSKLVIIDSLFIINQICSLLRTDNVSNILIKNAYIKNSSSIIDYIEINSSPTFSIQNTTFKHVNIHDNCQNNEIVYLIRIAQKVQLIMIENITIHKVNSSSLIAVDTAQPIQINITIIKLHSRHNKCRFSCLSVPVQFLNQIMIFRLINFTSKHNSARNILELNFGTESEVLLKNIPCTKQQEQYSLQKTDTLCRNLNPQVMKSVELSLIELREGFWRSGFLTDRIESCLLWLNSCNGGFQYSDQSCKEGYKGAICFECDSDNHFHRNIHGKCINNQYPDAYMIIWIFLSLTILKVNIKSTQEYWQARRQFLLFYRKYSHIVVKARLNMNLVLVIILANYQQLSNLLLDRYSNYHNTIQDHIQLLSYSDRFTFFQNAEIQTHHSSAIWMYYKLLSFITQCLFIFSLYLLYLLIQCKYNFKPLKFQTIIQLGSYLIQLNVLVYFKQLIQLAMPMYLSSNVYVYNRLDIEFRLHHILSLILGHILILFLIVIINKKIFQMLTILKERVIILMKQISYILKDEKWTLLLWINIFTALVMMNLLRQQSIYRIILTIILATVCTRFIKYSDIYHNKIVLKFQVQIYSRNVKQSQTSRPFNNTNGINIIMKNKGMLQSLLQYKEIHKAPQNLHLDHLHVERVVHKLQGSLEVSKFISYNKQFNCILLIPKRSTTYIRTNIYIFSKAQSIN